MSRPAARALRFVRHLMAGGAVSVADGMVRVAARDGGGVASLPQAEVMALVSAGVLDADGARICGNATTRGWLRRAMLDEDAFAAQHRTEQRLPDGPVVNLAESPLLRLASVAPGESAPFLAPHQVEAGERVRRLAERAALGARLSTRYDAMPAVGSGASGEISDMAADARRSLARLHAVLPRDCAGVVLDVCAHDKGLQQIEADRGWPRRSAKLVLRIGLDQLAEHWGLGAEARGPEQGRVRGAMAGARLPL